MIIQIQPQPQLPQEAQKPNQAPAPAPACSTPDCLRIGNLKLSPEASTKLKQSLATSSAAAKDAALKSVFTGGILGAEAGWAVDGLPGAAVGAVVGGASSALKGCLKSGALGFVKGTVAEKPARQTLLQTLQAMPSPAGSQCVVVQPGLLKDR